MKKALLLRGAAAPGNVFDRHDRDVLPLWRDGRYVLIGEPPVRVLVLEPC